MIFHRNFQGFYVTSLGGTNLKELTLGWISFTFKYGKIVH